MIGSLANKELERAWIEIETSWNVMAHGNAREGKWKGNWRMEWVASILHTTSEHGISSITTADAHISAASSRLNWRPPADLNGLANAVGSQYSSHYLRTRCIQHYYRWCAHLGCQQSTELTPHTDLNGLVRFARKTKYGFCACVITFQMTCNILIFTWRD